MLSVFLRFLRFRELFFMRFISFFFLMLVFVGSSSCYESIGDEFEVSAPAVYAPAAPHLGLTCDAVAKMAQAAARKRGRAGLRGTATGPSTPGAPGGAPGSRAYL